MEMLISKLDCFMYMRQMASATAATKTDEVPDNSKDSVHHMALIDELYEQRLKIPLDPKDLKRKAKNRKRNEKRKRQKRRQREQQPPPPPLLPANHRRLVLEPFELEQKLFRFAGLPQLRPFRLNK